MITDSFDNVTKPLISLRDIYGEQKRLADVCIVTFSEVIRSAVLASHACTPAAEIGTCGGGIPIVTFPHAGRTVAFYLSPIGAAAASQSLLEANWLTGAEKFILFGSAGSLAPEITANRFVVPTAAYRDEGTSYHYAPPGDYIGLRGSGTVRDVFASLGVPFAVGKTWTTDAVLRETTGAAAKRRAEGCITVEMELAGVQAACDFHALELYAFLAPGDVLSEDGYSLGTLSDANHNVDKLRLALELAERI